VAERDRSRGEAETRPPRKDPTAPKGRPTYGRRQRAAEARKRARRRRIKRRVTWTVVILVLIGIVVALVMLDIGAAPLPPG
jgi:hypothetical protein